MSTLRPAKDSPTKRVLALYNDSWTGLGPATLDDVTAACKRLDISDRRPWSPGEMRLIVDEMTRAARDRRPQWHVVTIVEGVAYHGIRPVLPDSPPGRPGDIETIDGLGLWFDPTGRLNNLDDAVALLKERARDATFESQITEAARLHAAGDPVPRIASKLGVSKSTLANRRRALRGAKIDPDDLGNLDR